MTIHIYATGLRYEIKPNRRGNKRCLYTLPDIVKNNNWALRGLYLLNYFMEQFEELTNILK